MPADSFDFLFPLVMMVPVALFFLGLGLRGLILRKPFVISSWWIFGSISFCFLPSVVLPYFRRAFEPIDLLLLIPLAIVIVLMALQFRGYTVYGVTDRSLREALLASLQKMNLPFEEVLGSIRLPSLGLDLLIASHPWVGTAQVRPRGQRKPAELKAIAQGMNDYFRSNPVETNLTTSVMEVVMGSMILLMQVYFLKL